MGDKGVITMGKWMTNEELLAYLKLGIKGPEGMGANGQYRAIKDEGAALDLLQGWR
jgi:hypothetical protein